MPLIDADRLPALEGGRPVRSTCLPYGRQTIDDTDVQAVLAALKSEYLTTGPRVANFERAFAEAVGARYAVAVASGTAALHAAAFAAGLNEDSEAITTPLTFAATANCARYLGARVVFADVRARTLTLDPVETARAMTARTRAIIACDFAGLPADLDELNDLARRHGAVLIEDACHALGGTYRGRRVGSIAPLTAFSFHPVKHITTGEGGMITTDDEALAAKLRIFRTHGIDERRGADGTWAYDMVTLGFNYRITDLQCGLGMSQLRRLNTWIERRRAIAARYLAAFAELAELEPPPTAPDREHAWHLYVIRLNFDRLRVGRDVVFRALRAENIGVNVHYIPVPWHSYYQRLGYQRGQWPVAENAYERAISLPLFAAMTDGDVDDVIRAVHKILRHYAA